MSLVRVGLSGYAYPEWQGDDLFYPPEAKRREYLTRYAGRYDALEAVGTWRQMPSEATVARWIAETPEGFRLCPKMHADVTHVARLKPKGFETLNAFVHALEPIERAGRLGQVLVQLPPNLKRDDAILSEFLGAAPHRPSLRWAVEFRHPSWEAPEVEAILSRWNVAWVTVDEEGVDATMRDTADHAYVRLRRTEYNDDALQIWAGRLKGMEDGVAFVRHKDVERPWRYADRLIDLLQGS